ncbi:EAL domain-containing protein [Jiella sp. MQZ9-1]|uniref:EAL domain-containing protein n=1 Tax=Jiella flava TaxID=2816857 RepID=A0A939FSC5_9HYPH|nr:EAL domain-containing protein [Jiella flava]MBO0661013.1 EAL domain-containing protein [Jiella flava]MCD2469661.1 EAL domain-containing protein [Jiella flava]
MRFSEAADWFSLRNVGDRMFVSQLHELRPQLPLLYAFLAINIASIAYSFRDQAPLTLTIFMPVLMLSAFLARTFFWIRPNVESMSAEAARSKLRRAIILSAVVSAIYVFWALALTRYGDKTTEAHVMVFSAITVIGCILSLTLLPQAALIVSAVVVVPPLFIFLNDGGAEHLTISFNLALVIAVMIKVMLNSFESFRQSVQSMETAETLSHANLQLAHTDLLTEIPNRRFFFEVLENRINAAVAAGKPLTLGIVGLDRFKLINDVHGYIVGDKLLQAVAQRLRAVVDDSIVVARLGGDEFAFLVESDESAGRAIGERVCNAMTLPFEVAGLNLRVTASCGLATLGADESADSLFGRTAFVVHSCKAERRSAVTAYSFEHEAKVRSTREIESALRQANLVNELQLVLQPIIDLRRDEIVAVEVLARWKSPVLGDVRPDLFIAVAERMGMMHEVTLTLLDKALAIAARLPPAIKLSFNLSAHDLTNSMTVLSIVARVLKSGLPSYKLIFELTETVLMRDFEIAESTIILLRSLDCEIALDDFGTGYSSLSYLHRLSIDRVKIDRSFVRDYKSQNGAALLRSILALCSSVGLPCIAEGVEDDDQVSSLEELGYHKFQGYHFARPMPFEAFDRWLATWNAEPSHI